MQVLITAGPTREPIDPVRFISNHSSGKMGIALAHQFAERGHHVVLVKGPTDIALNHPMVTVVEVENAAQMFNACAQYFGSSDVIVFAAAVADYTPGETSPVKIKKTGDVLTLNLVKTKDIALELGRIKQPGQLTVGFALETDHEEENAKQKLQKKNFDFIVLNSTRDEGAGFKVNTNKITIIDKNGNTVKFDLKTKTEVAKDIVDYAMKMKGYTT